MEKFLALLENDKDNMRRAIHTGQARLSLEQTWHIIEKFSSWKISSFIENSEARAAYAENRIKTQKVWNEMMIHRIPWMSAFAGHEGLLELKYLGHPSKFPARIYPTDDYEEQLEYWLCRAGRNRPIAKVMRAAQDKPRALTYFSRTRPQEMLEFAQEEN